MGCGKQGIGLREPGATYLVGEEFAVPAQGDCVDLSTRINLDGHQLSSIKGGKLESCIKGYLSGGCTLCVQGTFGLGHGSKLSVSMMLIPSLEYLWGVCQ